MKIASRPRRAALFAIGLLLLLTSPVSGGAGGTRPGAAQPPFDPFETSIPALQSALSSGRTTSRALVAFHLARVAAFDRRGPNLHAMVTINQRALVEADRLDAERLAGKLRGPMHGIPILLKDNFETADLPTSAGTLALANNRPSKDAELVRRLRAAGAIIIGKASMHELATGAVGVSSLTGISRNPYDPLRSPGGSSGGTAAGVAANFAAAGVGTDTCASIRTPAAYQNLFGMRVSRNLWSMEGIIPLSPSQDVAGPLARSAEDLAIMMDAMTGTSDRRYASGLHDQRLEGARFGVVRELTGDAPEDAAGKLIFEQSLATMRAQGAHIIDVTIPDLERRLKDSNVIRYEFGTSLKSYLATRPGAPVGSLPEFFERGLFHRDIDVRLRSRFAAGAAVDAKEYARASAEAQALRQAVLDVIASSRLDALIYPTSLRPPPLIIGDERGGAAVCQLSAGSGLPALAVPLGLTPEDLPIGMELLGPAFSEAKLISIAHDWERVASPRRAPFSTPRLVGGKVPRLKIFVPGLRKKLSGTLKMKIDFDFDITTSMLRYTANLRGSDGADIIATVQSMRDGGPGPVVTHLLSRERHGAGEVRLSAEERRRLLSDELYVQVYSEDFPIGMIENAHKTANLQHDRQSQ